LKVSNSVAVHRGNRQYTGSTQAELQMSWKGVQNSLKLVQELGAGTVWLILILLWHYSFWVCALVWAYIFCCQKTVVSCLCDVTTIIWNRPQSQFALQTTAEGM
jgi:hypothetical protein